VPKTILAHRGWSSRYPEMTRAAYRAAIEWAGSTGTELWLECDVHFSADDELICLHDLTLHRTAALPTRAIDLTVAQLKEIDFGSWVRPQPEPEQRELVTLAELFEMVSEARETGVGVSLAVETKHPNPRSLEVEDRLAAMLSDVGWDEGASPVRLITFSLDALERFARLLPAVPRSLLLMTDLGPWRGGELPEGVDVVGVDLRLLRKDPGYVARARAHGNEVYVFTVNEPGDIRFCRDLGVAGYITDAPQVAAEVLAEAG
jgi:glycerophosphoryl diester phosphodiesterase